MAKWDRMTRQAWEKSVVAQEFEKHIIELAQKLEVIAQSTTSTISEKGKQIEESLTGATESVSELTDAAKNLNEDGETEEESKEELEAKAQESLLEELNAAAIAAADMGNIKLAYRIERTISEITGE
jgi:hypothetical protein